MVMKGVGYPNVHRFRDSNVPSSRTHILTRSSGIQDPNPAGTEASLFFPTKYYNTVAVNDFIKKVYYNVKIYFQERL